jgi:hypothetical protein
MTIDIETLMASVTADQIFDRLLGVLETAGVPARSWRRGGVARSVLGALSDVGYQGSVIVRDGIRGMFLAFAEGSWLAAHAEDTYGTEKIAATFATGEVTFSNTGGAVHSFGADEIIVIATESGARYRVTEAFIIPSGSVASPGTVTVEVTAIDSGSTGSAAPGEIDTLETPLSKVTVSNEAALVGVDEETDEALRARCRAKRGTWSPFGPRDAYEYAALSATLTDGTPAGVTRVAVSRYSSTGTVTVVCATASGTPTSDELDAVEENVEAIARPDTVTATVSGAVPVATTHTITVWARGGVADTIEDNAQAAMAALIATYPIGGISKTQGGQGYLFADQIAATIIASSPEVFDVDGVGDDIALEPDEVATNVTTFDVRII